MKASHARRYTSKYVYYFIAGIIAIAIDVTFLHAGFHILGFDVPENLEYFVSKYVVIVFSIWLFPRFVSGIAQKALLTGFAGSAIFSLYYALTRPDPLGLADRETMEQGGGIYSYGDYVPPELTMEQNVIIYVVHALGIAAAYTIFYVMTAAKAGKKSQANRSY